MHIVDVDEELLNDEAFDEEKLDDQPQNTEKLKKLDDQPNATTPEDDNKENNEDKPVKITQTKTDDKKQENKTE